MGGCLLGGGPTEASAGHGYTQRLGVGLSRRRQHGIGVVNVGTEKAELQKEAWLWW